MVPEVGPALTNNKGRDLPAPHPVQPGPLLIWMMVLWQEVWGVLVMRPHLTQICPGRMLMTLIWTQLLETASLAWTEIKWLYELPRRGYKLPVGSGKAVSRPRLSWKGSAKAARLCGDTTMRAFKWSGIVLLQKTATPLRCVGWWSGLTNCSTLQQPLTPKFTQETHGWARTLVLLLKQNHDHFYHFYEKGMTRAMVGLQGLHLSDAFRHSNVSSSVGLKSFGPWCFKLGGQQWNNNNPSEGSALLIGHCLWPL